MVIQPVHASKATLFTLPAEVRNSILSCVLVEDGPLLAVTHYNDNKHHKAHPDLPAIARTCR